MSSITKNDSYHAFVRNLNSTAKNRERCQSKLPTFGDDLLQLSIIYISFR